MYIGGARVFGIASGLLAAIDCVPFRVRYSECVLAIRASGLGLR